MSEILEKIANCIEFGKMDKASLYPPNMKDQDGADELTKVALQKGILPEDILSKSLVIGMHNIGVKFRDNKVFVPEVLMAARAMTAAMVHLKPYFQSGNIKLKGTFIICTVKGDLHDIGKRIVSMMVEGAGFKVIDLGTDVDPNKIIETIEQNPDCAVGLSALLTTTMANMENTVKAIKKNDPKTKVLIGGAPVTNDFRKKIGADFYSPDPQGAVEFLNEDCSR